MHLDGGVTAGDGGITRGSESRLTRAEVSFLDGSQALASATASAMVPGAEELVAGVRTLRQESIITDAAWAAQQAADLAVWAGAEGAAWQPPPLSWDVRDGFDSTEQVAALLLGGESLSLLFLTRSWLPEFGVRPVLAAIGGQISYRGGRWQVELTTSRAGTDTRQHAISWEEIDDGTAANTLRWSDTATADGLHESVTYEDIGFVGMGLGVTVAPADAGWDQYQ